MLLTRRFGNDELRAVSIAPFMPGRRKSVSVPMKSLLRVDQSAGFITTKVGDSPPAASVILVRKLDIGARVKPVFRDHGAAPRLMYCPLKNELPADRRFTPP